jgi:4-amino-4-deoxy-L-arabinose transferase-like glycosyltransferase
MFKKISWGVILVGVLLISLFLVTRLTNLTKLPIFTDEAIYLRWAQIGSQDASWRFISMTDGKQPMFTWIMMVTLKFFQDPLVAGRVASVIGGFASVIGIALVTHELFKNRLASVLASLFYILSPFTLMHDRMALYDSWVGAFSLWSLYLSILLVRRLRLDVALLLGFALGLGMLNKTSGFIGLYLLPVTLVLFDWGEANRTKRLWKWVGLCLVSLIVSQGMYAVLRLSPFFYLIAQKNTVFVYPFAEWIRNPFINFYGKLYGLVEWTMGYMTAPVFIFSFLTLLVFWQKLKEKILLFSYFIIPFIGLVSLGKVLFPRFVLFMTLPLYILCAYGLAMLLIKYKKQLFSVMAVVVLFAPAVYTSFIIITNPLYAPIPSVDRGEYIDDWPSGGGQPEMVAFIKEESRTHKISVYTEGTFGLFPHSLELYYADDPNVKLKGIWPLTNTIPQEILEDAKVQDTYVIVNQSLTLPPWPATRIAQYLKGTRADRTLKLYKVIPPVK